MGVIKTTGAALPALLKRRNTATFRAIARGALRGAHRGRAILVRKTPVDQGQLKAAWKVEPGELALLTGKAPIRNLTNAKLAELVNSAPHAGIVELGARPHPVSPEGIRAIADWVLRNLEIELVAGPIQRGTGGRRAFVRKTRDQLALGIAQAIAWKIRHEGQKPTYYVRDTIPELERAVKTEVDRAIGDVAGRGSV